LPEIGWPGTGRRVLSSLPDATVANVAFACMIAAFACMTAAFAVVALVFGSIYRR
jgi:hypothetical protein